MSQKPESHMTEAMLKKALSAVREQIREAEGELEEIHRKMNLARQEERLLVQLLKLRGQHLSDASSENSPNLTNLQDTEESTSISAHPVIKAVIGELASAGRPVHISDLMRVLHEAGIRVPGSGTQANLISYLRREPQLVRTSRGMYGLAAWGLENMPIIRRENRSRVRFRHSEGGNTNEH